MMQRPTVTIGVRDDSLARLATTSATRIYRRPSDCPHLGAKLSGQPCGGDLYECRFDATICSSTKPCGDNKVPVSRCCQTCPHHPAALLQVGTAAAPPKVETNPWANPIRVPQVPFLRLTPNRDRAVVTIAAGAKGREMLAISGPLLQAYADRIDADFVVLDWPGHPDWPMSSKFILARILDYYNRVAYLDADVIVRPGAVDLFGACEVDEIGAFNDWPLCLSLAPEFAAEYVQFRKFVGLPTGVRNPIPYYCNTGVMVFSRAHWQVFTVPDRPIPPIHCGEQHWWVSRMLDTKARVKLLPEVFNYQWWAKDAYTMGPVPDDAILHFSGMNQFGHAKRLEEMRRWAGEAARPAVSG